MGCSLTTQCAPGLPVCDWLQVYSDLLPTNAARWGLKLKPNPQPAGPTTSRLVTVLAELEADHPTAGDPVPPRNWPLVGREAGPEPGVRAGPAGGTLDQLADAMLTEQARADQLWRGWLGALEHRWQARASILGGGTGRARMGADHRHCLLHQKLQLLDLCTQKLSGQPMPPVESKQVGGLKLLNEPECDLVSPCCLPSLVLPEDQVEQALESLLHSEAGSRAAMQADGLLSDMQSFKAANPRAILPDFVRWHSPKDWVEQPDGSHQLSARMAGPDNLWHQLWQQAVALPAEQQPFPIELEPTGQALLDWIQGLGGRQRAEAMAGPLLQAAGRQLGAGTGRQLQAVTDGLRALGGVDGLQGQCDELAELEAMQMEGEQLLQLWPDCHRTVSALVARREYNDLSADERAAVGAVFLESEAGKRAPELQELLLVTGEQDSQARVQGRMYVSTSSDGHCVVATSTLTDLSVLLPSLGAS